MGDAVDAEHGAAAHPPEARRAPAPTTAPSSPDAEAAAEATAPLARRLAARAEAERRLPAPLVEALRDAGLFRLFVPTRYGGPECEPLTGLRAIETVAQADGAAGWCVNIASTTATMSWYLDPAWAQRIYGDPTVITGGTFAPNGRGRAVDDGFVIDEGRWSWGSGTQHCQWVNCGVLTDRGTFHLMYVPRDEVIFHDTWYAAGLRGTGSLDFEVRGAFVPTGRELQPGRSRTRVDTPLCHFPNFALLAAGLAAVTLGIGARALEELATAAGRTPTMGTQPLSSQSYVQLDLARATARLGSARAYLHDRIGRLWDLVQAGGRASLLERAEARLAAHNAAAEAAQAVDSAFTAAGGSAVYADGALQRCLRDVHVATQHVMLSPRVLETYARVRLGLEVDTALL
jgi:alkylation response protein AidB-like acyl-CoA dehydrogenase